MLPTNSDYSPSGEIEYIRKQSSQLVCACREDAVRMRLGMPFGPAALRGLIRLNILLTSATEKESPQSMIAGCVGGTVLSSKKVKKGFSL